jgi:hypothetical protein
MIGDGKLSKHEADVAITLWLSCSIWIDDTYVRQTIQTVFKKELDKFDRDRALLAWDGLISKQQTTLASRGVPTMFVSVEGADRDVCGIICYSSVKSS